MFSSKDLYNNYNPKQLKDLLKKEKEEHAKESKKEKGIKRTPWNSARVVMQDQVSYDANLN